MGDFTPLTTLKCLKVCMMANEGHFRVEKRRVLWEDCARSSGCVSRGNSRGYCGHNDFVDEKPASSPSRTWCCWKVMLAAVGFAE